MVNDTPIVVTIDGPAGAGKTTVSKILAGKLGYRYFDTGALYRGVALEALNMDISTNDDKHLGKMVGSLDLRFVIIKNQSRLFSRGNDITHLIRTPEITMMASAISANPLVRDRLLDFQRQAGREKGVVFEGRDMGTVVFPEAEVKFFLDGSIKVRAMRRFNELRKKSPQTLEDVEQDIIKRDRDDSTRTVAPLKAAHDAIHIDTTDLTINKVVTAMLGEVSGYHSGLKTGMSNSK